MRIHRRELFTNQKEDDEYNLENNLRDQIQKIKDQNRERLEKERQRIQQDFNLRLDRDRERERMKYSKTNTELDDKKQEARRENDLALRDKKRTIERKTRDEIKEVTERFNEDQDKSMVDVKE